MRSSTSPLPALWEARPLPYLPCAMLNSSSPRHVGGSTSPFPRVCESQPLPSLPCASLITSPSVCGKPAPVPILYECPHPTSPLASSSHHGRCEQLNELLGRIGRHYFYQASQALLRIAGDLDLLGSPVALFGNLGSGVMLYHTRWRCSRLPPHISPPTSSKTSHPLSYHLPS